MKALSRWRARGAPAIGRSGAILGLVVALIPLAAPGAGGQSTERNPPASVTLIDAVRRGLEHHPRVSEARAAHLGAEADLEVAGAARLPSLAVDGSLLRFQEPMVVAPLHGFDIQNPPLFDRNLVQGNLSVGYTLFDGGARGARIRGASAGTEAASVAVRGAELDIIQVVSDAYLAVLTSEQKVVAGERLVEALQGERRRVELLLGEGRAARVDLLRVEAALSRAEAELVSATSQRDVARRELGRITGIPVLELHEGALAPLRLTIVPLLDREEALARARGNSPELEQARKGLLIAEATRAEAGSSWMPSLQAGARFMEYGTAGGDFTGEWQATIQVSYPVFTGGSRSGAVRRAEAEQTRASERLRLAELQVAGGIDRALGAAREARALAEALNRASAQSEEVARIERLALEAGAGVQTDYLAAEAELFRSRAALTQARHGEIAALVHLARAMGDLSVEWLEQNLESVR